MLFQFTIQCAYARVPAAYVHTAHAHTQATIAAKERLACESVVERFMASDLRMNRMAYSWNLKLLRLQSNRMRFGSLTVVYLSVTWITVQFKSLTLRFGSNRLRFGSLTVVYWSASWIAYGSIRIAYGLDCLQLYTCRLHESFTVRFELLTVQIESRIELLTVRFESLTVRIAYSCILVSFMNRLRFGSNCLRFGSNRGSNRLRFGLLTVVYLSVS